MKRILYSLITILIAIALLEISLRTIDPWGAFAYYADMHSLREQYVRVADGRVYTLPPSKLDLRGWSVEMTAQGRIVPNSGRADCIIAFVGDSYTFGHGVTNTATFANQIAQQFPNVTIQNRGVNGYNTAQVLTDVELSSADGYVYLIIGNDTEPVRETILHPQPMQAIQGLRVYWYYFGEDMRKRRTVQAETPNGDIPEWFNQSIAALAAREDVLMVGFEHDPLGRYVAEEYPDTVLIPPVGPHTNSKADGHPNAQGHQNIADAMRPFVQPFVQSLCEDT